MTPFVNVANREYFRNVERRRSWPDGSLAATFLEPIQSMTTGETTIAFSRSVEESAVRAVAIIAPMRSVIDSVLPEAYRFAILDREGTVLLHSDAGRNDRENLIEETENDSQLRSLLRGRGTALPWCTTPLRAESLP